MMGIQKVEAQLFYEFDLDAHVPPNHVLREIDHFLDMCDMRERLKPFYSHTGRPSIDPEPNAATYRGRSRPSEQSP